MVDQVNAHTNLLITNTILAQKYSEQRWLMGPSPLEFVLGGQVPVPATSANDGQIAPQPSVLNAFVLLAAAACTQHTRLLRHDADTSVAPTMLGKVMTLALIVSCNAQFGPPIGPLSQFAGVASSAWQDLSVFGGPVMGISAELLQTLAGLAKQVFSMGIDAAASYLAGGGLSTMNRAALPAGVLC